MTFYSTPIRQGKFDVNQFEESMGDYGKQVATSDDLGAVGGMLGYGNIYHNTRTGELPGGSYMSGSPQSPQGIRNEGANFTTLGCETYQTASDTRFWGIRILDPGVWLALIKFTATGNDDDRSSSYWIQTEDGQTITTESGMHVANGGRVHMQAHKVIVADEPGQTILPIAISSAVRWHEGEMSMTVFRIDGNSGAASALSRI